MAHMNLSTKQKQTHWQRDQTCGCQGSEGWGKRMDWEFGVGRCKLLYIDSVNNKVLLYSIGNYSRSPNHNGKEYWENHADMSKTESLRCTVQIGMTIISDASTTKKSHHGIRRTSEVTGPTPTGQSPSTASCGYAGSKESAYHLTRPACPVFSLLRSSCWWKFHPRTLS